jgi:putative tricarboxylic transport membrane protein
MEFFLEGFINAIQPVTFLHMVFGVILGIIIGALPGMTASMGIILLLPLTYHLEPATALVMLAGMYCGSMYGGSISAILINTPGTPSAAATVLDGHPLAQQGKAAKAIGMAAIASFTGGLLSVICLILLSPQLARVALRFQPPDYFMLAIFGLTIMASTSGGNMVKGLISGITGLLIASVGIDGVMGTMRFTFGIPSLSGGFAVVPVLIGLFAVPEVLWKIAHKGEQGNVMEQKLKGILPSLPELKSVIPAILIGSAIGIFIGIVPGTGGAIACFLAYNEVRRWSKNKEKFGKGALEGIAAAESSNNGTTGGALVPMLSLGVPGDVVTAVMLGALMLIGVRPGPLLFTESPIVVYTLFGGLLLAQFVMLISGLLLAKISPKILGIPNNILMPIVMVLCVVGAFTLNNNLFDVLVAMIFGIIGYVMRKHGYPAAPMVLGVVLGPMAEGNLNRALLISQNNWATFIQSPISLAFLILSIASVGLAYYSSMSKKGKEAGASSNRI